MDIGTFVKVLEDDGMVIDPPLYGVVVGRPNVAHDSERKLFMVYIYQEANISVVHERCSQRAMVVPADYYIGRASVFYECELCIASQENAMKPYYATIPMVDEDVLAVEHLKGLDRIVLYGAKKGDLHKVPPSNVVMRKSTWVLEVQI